MALRTFSYSRFVNTPAVIIDGHEVYGPWHVPDSLLRPSTFSPIRYKVPNSQAGRPDLIANQFYAASQLDWLIIAFNNATQVFNWPKAGEVINVINPSLVSSELL